MRRAHNVIELVIVMAIVATVSAIAMPRLGNALALSRLDGAASRIKADLPLARSHAMTADASVFFDIYGRPGSGVIQFRIGDLDRTIPLGADTGRAVITR